MLSLPPPSSDLRRSMQKARSIERRSKQPQYIHGFSKLKMFCPPQVLPQPQPQTCPQVQPEPLHPPHGTPLPAVAKANPQRNLDIHHQIANSSLLFEDSVISSIVTGCPNAPTPSYFGYCPKPTPAKSMMDLRPMFPIANIGLLKWTQLLPPLHENSRHTPEDYENPSNHSLDLSVVPKQVLSWLRGVHDAGHGYMDVIRQRQALNDANYLTTPTISVFENSEPLPSSTIHPNPSPTPPWTLYLCDDDCKTLYDQIFQTFETQLLSMGWTSKGLIRIDDDLVGDNGTMFDMDDVSNSTKTSGPTLFPLSRSQDFENASVVVDNASHHSTSLIDLLGILLGCDQTTAHRLWTVFFTSHVVLRALYVFVIANAPHILGDSVCAIIPTPAKFTNTSKNRNRCTFSSTATTTAAPQPNADVRGLVEVAPLITHIALAAKSLAIIAPSLLNGRSKRGITCPYGHMQIIHLEQYTPITTIWETNIPAVNRSSSCANTSIVSRPCLVPNHSLICDEMSRRFKQQVTIDTLCKTQWTHSATIQLPYDRTFVEYLHFTKRQPIGLVLSNVKMMKGIKLDIRPPGPSTQSPSSIKSESRCFVSSLLEETNTRPALICGNDYSLSTIRAILGAFYVKNVSECDDGDDTDSISCHLSLVKPNVHGGSGRVGMATMTCRVPSLDAYFASSLGRDVCAENPKRPSTLADIGRLRTEANVLRLVVSLSSALSRAVPVSPPCVAGRFVPHTIPNTNIASLTVSYTSSGGAPFRNGQHRAENLRKFVITPQPSSTVSNPKSSVLCGASFNTLCWWMWSNNATTPIPENQVIAGVDTVVENRMVVSDDDGTKKPNNHHLYSGSLDTHPLIENDQAFEVASAREEAQSLLTKFGVRRRSGYDLSFGPCRIPDVSTRMIWEISCAVKQMSLEYSKDVERPSYGHASPTEIYRELSIQAILSIDRSATSFTWKTQLGENHSPLAISWVMDPSIPAFGGNRSSTIPTFSPPSVEKFVSITNKHLQWPSSDDLNPSTTPNPNNVGGCVVIDNSHTCPLLGYTVQGDTIAAILPLFQRGSFYDHISLQKIRLRALSGEAPLPAMSPYTVIRVCRDMLQAATFLATRGISHGDVSPLNVFLDADFNGHLGDFGMSTVVGTPRWNSFGNTPYYPFSFGTEDDDHASYGIYQSNFDDIAAIGVLIIYLFSSTSIPRVVRTDHRIGSVGAYCNTMYDVHVGDVRFPSSGSSMPCRVCRAHNRMIIKMMSMPIVTTQVLDRYTKKSYSGFDLFVDTYRGDASNKDLVLELETEGIKDEFRVKSHAHWRSTRLQMLQLAHTILLKTYIVFAANGVSKHQISSDNGLSIDTLMSFVCTADAILSMMKAAP